MGRGAFSLRARSRAYGSLFASNTRLALHGSSSSRSCTRSRLFAPYSSSHARSILHGAGLIIRRTLTSLRIIPLHRAHALKPADPFSLSRTLALERIFLWLQHTFCTLRISYRFNTRSIAYAPSHTNTRSSPIEFSAVHTRSTTH
jgi:hypothetical protein